MLFKASALRGAARVTDSHQNSVTDSDAAKHKNGHRDKGDNQCA
jgi:hypothetical protein